MTGIAMGIVLAAAFLHATWNYLAKCSQNKLAFIWWFILCALVFYLPMFLYYFPKTPINTEGWLFVLATGVIHFFYFWFLGTAYEKGDLSLVYPLARGSGPLLVPFLALMLIKEDITLTGGAGIALIVLGIYLSHLHSFTLSSFAEPFRSITKGGSSWALFTGLTIAAYSLIDKIGVGLVYPPVYIYFMLLLSWLFLTPLVFHHSQGRILREWQINKTSIMAVGLIVLGAYLMILFALTMAKVSYVVAVREVSIVFSVLYGVFRLKETHGVQKIFGAVMIALGVVFIGMSR